MIWNYVYWEELLLIFPSLMFWWIWQVTLVAINGTAFLLPNL